MYCLLGQDPSGIWKGLVKKIDSTEKGGDGDGDGSNNNKNEFDTHHSIKLLKAVDVAANKVVERADEIESEDSNEIDEDSIITANSQYGIILGPLIYSAWQLAKLGSKSLVALGYTAAAKISSEVSKGVTRVRHTVIQRLNGNNLNNLQKHGPFCFCGCRMIS